MNMPQFEDFIKTLSPEKMESIMDNVNANLNDVAKEIELSAAGHTVNQSAAIAFSISLSLLHEYHLWLLKML